MKLITRNTDYAAKALCHFAAEKGKTVTAKELADAFKMPLPYLRRILQSLNRKGYLNSNKGRGGGFALAVPPKEISLADIISVFQGRVNLNECLLNKKACPDKKNCVLKNEIDKIEKYVLGRMAKITVASLARNGKNGGTG